MSQTKLEYVYNSYDTILELIEAGDCKIDELMEKVRGFRDELPTEKEILLEYVNNMDDTT